MKASLWSCELRGLQTERLPPVLAEARPGLIPCRSPAACLNADVLWFTGSKPFRAAMLISWLVVLILLNCVTVDQANAKGQELLFITLWGYLWDTQWSYFTPSQTIIISETRLFLKVTCPARLPRLHLLCRKNIHSVSCSSSRIPPSSPGRINQPSSALTELPLHFLLSPGMRWEGPMWGLPQERESKGRDYAKNREIARETCPWEIWIQMFYTWNKPQEINGSS